MAVLRDTRENLGCSRPLSQCLAEASPAQGRIPELGISVGIVAVEESVPTTQPFLPLLPSFPPSGKFPTGTPRVFQQSREPLGPIRLPQAPPRSFFRERAAHHTRNSKNKVDFGAPGIPARIGFIFPPPLPEVVPLEKEFRRKNPKISITMVPSRLLRAGIDGGSGDRPEPTAGREGGSMAPHLSPIKNLG